MNRRVSWILFCAQPGFWALEADVILGKQEGYLGDALYKVSGGLYIS